VIFRDAAFILDIRQAALTRPAYRDANVPGSRHRQ
jgi:hypothetical protein